MILSHPSPLATHNKFLLHGLLEDLGCQVTGDLSDVDVLREGGSSGQVVFVDELHQGLGRSVDHGVGDDSGLAEGRSQCEAREDVPAGEH